MSSPRRPSETLHAVVRYEHRDGGTRELCGLTAPRARVWKSQLMDAVPYGQALRFLSFELVRPL